MNHQLNKQHADYKIIYTYLGKTQVFNSWHPMDANKNKTAGAVIVRKIWNSAFFFFFLGSHYHLNTVSFAVIQQKEINLF